MHIFNFYKFIYYQKKNIYKLKKIIILIILNFKDPQYTIKNKTIYKYIKHNNPWR